MKKFLVYSVIFLLPMVLGFWAVLNHFEDKAIQNHLNPKNEELSISYHNTIDLYSITAKLIIKEIIETDEILNLYSKAYKSDDFTKQKIRDSLFSKLEDTYSNMRIYDYRQLHFHLPDNSSFLRFHRPQKFGDNLSGIRSTVEYANREKKYCQGFEEGKIFNGFRYLFPLNWNGEHIGSVETSVSFKAIANQIEYVDNADCSFILRKEVVDEKVFDSEKSNYSISPISDDFYIEKKENDLIKEKMVAGNNTLFDVLNQVEFSIEENLKLKEFVTFSKYIHFDDFDFILSFLPVKNFDNEPVAFLIQVREDFRVNEIKANYKIYFLVGVVFLLFFFGYIVSLLRSNQKAKLLNEKITLQNKKVNEFADNLEQKNNELVLLKEKAEESNKAKSIFLANMSHEIRTPMNSILGFSEILLNSIESPTYRSYLNTILNSGKTLLALINDILDISKIEAGKIEITYKPTELRSLFSDMVSMFANKAESKGIGIEKFVDDSVPQNIMIDEVRLRQIVLNLIGNGIKFTDTGKVKLRCSFESDQSNNKLLISIIDTGIGIRDDQQDRIFSSFNQSRNQDAQKYGGTGLGLSISKKLAELMNGTILLNSEIGKGSTFTVVLNNVVIAEKGDITKSDYDWATNELDFYGAKLLIVDDIQDNIEILINYLKDTNLEIQFANNGNEAIEKVNKFTPDLIFMDIRMPGKSGYEVAKIIKSEINEELPIIAFTASTMKTEEEMAKLFFDGYIKKPASRNEVISYIAKFIDYKKTDNNNQEINTTGNSDFVKNIKSKPEIEKSFKENFINQLDDLLLLMNPEDLEKYSDDLIIFANDNNISELYEFGNELKNLILNFNFNKIEEQLNHIKNNFID